MEERAGADHFLLAGERDAALTDGLVEVFDGLEIAIDQGLVDEGPQMLGRLQLGAVGGLEDEANAVGHDEVLGPCQPALSSCSTMRFLRPAPADLAKSARMSSKYALQMLLETFHTVWPVAGSTKPVT